MQINMCPKKESVEEKLQDKILQLGPSRIKVTFEIQRHTNNLSNYLDTIIEDAKELLPPNLPEEFVVDLEKFSDCRDDGQNDTYALVAYNPNSIMRGNGGANGFEAGRTSIIYPVEEAAYYRHLEEFGIAPFFVFVLDEEKARWVDFAPVATGYYTDRWEKVPQVPEAEYEEMQNVFANLQNTHIHKLKRELRELQFALDVIS